MLIVKSSGLEGFDVLLLLLLLILFKKYVGGPRTPGTGGGFGTTRTDLS